MRKGKHTKASLRDISSSVIPQHFPLQLRQPHKGVYYETKKSFDERSKPPTFSNSTVLMNHLPFTMAVPSGDIQHFLAQHQQQNTVAPTLLPTPMDVLFGRGKPYQGHPGNIRLHKVVELYKARYSQVRRHLKTEIAEEIVQLIKTGGPKAGRFLKRADGDETWEEVSDSVAREKVSHALRGKPRKEEKGIGEKKYNSHTEAIIEELKNTKRTADDQNKADSIQHADSHQTTKKRRIEEPLFDFLALASRSNGNQTMLPLGTFPPAQAVPARLAIPTTSSPSLLSSIGLPQDDVRLQLVAVAIAERERRLKVEMSLRELLHPTVTYPGLLQNEQSILSSALLQSARNMGQSKVHWF